jgi:hypothetical protein
MHTILRLVGRADIFLSRLNAGLAVLALALACAVAIRWAALHPEIYQLEQDEAAAASGIAPADSAGE